MADRFFTEKELDALSRTPRQQVVDCLEAGGAVGPLAESIARSLPSAPNRASTKKRLLDGVSIPVQTEWPIRRRGRWHRG